ncbi:hypothetical protein F5I97DRAFT_1814580 [Phlebopus sp. FC_14]|nr:hypothetical protein F5I97DRAFT_1814580 [Phlebopus sp. FC_14]
MQTASSPLPCIYVSPASPEGHHPDAYCPFPPAELEDHHGFRAKCLFQSPTAPRHSSPLRPTNGPVCKGLDRGQIASHGRKPLLRTQKSPNLRKELALKNQRNKQLERRTFLLSKVEEATCALSASIPPLSAFEYATNENTIDMCSEDVAGFKIDVSQLNQPPKPVPRTRATFPVPRMRSKRLAPSLDEITARLGGSSFVKVESTNCSVDQDILSSQLPSFSGTSLLPSRTPAPAENRPQISVGRLRLPVRSVSLHDPPVEPSSNLQAVPCMPRLVLTTSAVPHAANDPPLTVGEPDSCAVNRLCTAKNMMLTLTRRGSPPPPGHRPGVKMPMKRHSAPAELCRGGPSDFDHAVLSMPGGF